MLSIQRKTNNIFGLGFEIGQSSNSYTDKILYDIFRSKCLNLEEKKEDPLITHENLSKAAKSQLQTKNRNILSRHSWFFKPKHSWKSQSYFYGYCFCCNRFGHKASKCRFSQRQSSFFGLYNIRCFNCHKMGHTNRLCRFSFENGKTQRKLFKDDLKCD